MIILHFDLQPQFKYMNYFIYTSHHFTPHGRYELNKLTSLQLCGLIAQLTGRASHWYSRRSRDRIPLSLTGLYTKWDSFTPRKYKVNLIHTLTCRCFCICWSPSLLRSCLDELGKALLWDLKSPLVAQSRLKPP